MELTTITYEVRDGVAHVRFDRPEAANSVNPTFSADLRQVLLDIEFDDDVKAACFTAEGKIFCGGGDLKLFAELGPDLPQVASDMLIDFHGAIYKMNRIPKPCVAAVRGAAGGAGISLMSAFDLVVSSDSAKYTMGYTKVGMTPDGTSSYFIARHIGLRRMMDLALTNRVLSASEAESWGLVNRVVPDDEVDEAAAELAQSFADGAAWALGQAKRVIYTGYETGLEDAGEHEGQMITQAMATHDGQEGIQAFANKRTPEFKGTDERM